MVAFHPAPADAPVFTDGPHPTFADLIARKGLNAKHLIANDKRRRTLRATSLGQSVIPGLFDRVRVEHEKANVAYPHERAAIVTEHERMLLSQCVDDATRAREYFALFDRLNRFVHVPVAFPAPCDLGDEESAS